MSIENDLKRIADALEKIAVYQGGAPTTTITSAPATTVEVNPAVSTEIKTVAELKTLAQNIAATLPEGGVGAFTDFVRNEICARLGVKKLVEIPVDRIPEAGKILVAYGKKA